jgi:hypothetical protein
MQVIFSYSSLGTIPGEGSILATGKVEGRNALRDEIFPLVGLQCPEPEMGGSPGIQAGEGGNSDCLAVSHAEKAPNLAEPEPIL